MALLPLLAETQKGAKPCGQSSPCIANITLKLADVAAGSIYPSIPHALPSRYKYKSKIKISGSEMRLTVQLLLAMAMIPSFVQAARAEGAAGPIHIATYVEVGTPSDKDGSKLLQ